MSSPPPARRGFYRQEVTKTAWEVRAVYQDLQPVGSGAYGAVCSAVDSRTGAKVAIKKLYRPFQSELFAKRAYRELRLLKHMRHENVIGLLDVFTPDETLDDFTDFYLVMPFMGTDLGKLMKHEKLSEDRIQFLVYQMLKGLKYIHAAGVIHRDLKPGNLAVNEDCELKILDFGLARQADSEMTGYVVTRWYRAPEVILNWMRYTQTGEKPPRVAEPPGPASQATPAASVSSWEVQRWLLRGEAAERARVWQARRPLVCVCPMCVPPSRPAEP